MEYYKGETVIVLDANERTAGEAIVKSFRVADRKYVVLFQYPFSKEEEEIELPPWMLRKKFMAIHNMNKLP